MKGVLSTVEEIDEGVIQVSMHQGGSLFALVTCWPRADVLREVERFCRTMRRNLTDEESEAG